jgi:nucleoside-diphosphate-sugar epimerase
MNLIIGGNGFIGTYLSKQFRKNDSNFHILDKNLNVDGFCDVQDLDSIKFDKKVDAVINLAAEHKDNVQPITLYDSVNVLGARNVCAFCRAKGIEKIIFTSSVAIYGFAPADTNESGKPNYFNDYGRTKFLAEQVYKEWQAEDPNKRTLVIVRPTVVFGEGNRGNVYNLLKQIASKRFVMFGNGKNEKSMAYVENVAAFLEYSLSFKPGLHIYNYIDKPDFNMNNLVSLARKTLFGKYNVGIRLPAFLGVAIGYIADLVARVIRKNLPVSSIRVKKFLGTTQFSSSIAETGFEPPIELGDALVKTLRYEFIEDNSDKPTYETE